MKREESSILSTIFFNGGILQMSEYDNQTYGLKFKVIKSLTHEITYNFTCTETHINTVVSESCDLKKTVF